MEEFICVFTDDNNNSKPPKIGCLTVIVIFVILWLILK